ncbi:hypothetical protein Fsol_00068 [Candidatus Fokinia solitaria]|uniref:Uncharacterized protein n=1 Tax=Candidatus Fokinia solitaria TaxID=1802984 RepID=A0A2U8BRB5_9RICK|nr:hypothetical protein Fsol_00068 [Candidatus Fokinia solitaria]
MDSVLAYYARFDSFHISIRILKIDHVALCRVATAVYLVLLCAGFIVLLWF